MSWLVRPVAYSLVSQDKKRNGIVNSANISSSLSRRVRGPLKNLLFGERERGGRGSLKYLNNRVAEDWNGHFAAGRFLNNLFSTVHHRYALCIYTGSSIPRDGSIGGINQPSMFISLLRVFVVVFRPFSFPFFLSFFLSFFFFSSGFLTTQ